MSTTGCLEYKGYLGSVEIALEARGFHGRIEFIEDLVTFEGSSFRELDREFKAAVDDYLATCKEAGKEPDVPFKGTFNVRLGADLHKQAAIVAKRTGRSLNDLVKEAVERRLEDDHRVVQHVHEHRVQVIQRTEPVTFPAMMSTIGGTQWIPIGQHN